MSAAPDQLRARRAKRCLYHTRSANPFRKSVGLTKMEFKNARFNFVLAPQSLLPSDALCCVSAVHLLFPRCNSTLLQ